LDGRDLHPSFLRKIPAEKVAANAGGESKAHFPFAIETKVKSLGVYLGLITRPRAKAYGFNFNEWKRMMEAASNVNYENLSETGRKFNEVLLSSSG
jgi:hypothetical protein